MIQYSDEYWAVRAGKITASEMSKVMAKGKSGGDSVTRTKYIRKLAIERMTGKTIDEYKNETMQRGNELEAEARDLYSFVTGFKVVLDAFIVHPVYDFAGCSPDCMVEPDGMAQIKCPEYHTHYEYLLTREIPTIYKKQMSFELGCSGRKWNDFVSYNPHFPPDLRLLVIRYEFDAEMEKLQIYEIIKLNDEVSATINALKSMRGKT